MCTSKCIYDKPLSIVALLFIIDFKVSLWLLFTTHDVWEAALWLILLVHPLLSKDKEGAALTVHYLPYCAPFPRLNQSLQGDWLLSWLASELQVEEEEACRVQVEAVLLGLRKKDKPLEMDFWGSSDCCCNLSCWLMMIWMSSWGEVGKRREWAGSMRSRDSVWCLIFDKDSSSILPSYHNNTLYGHLTITVCHYCCGDFSCHWSLMLHAFL